MSFEKLALGALLTVLCACDDDREGRALSFQFALDSTAAASPQMVTDTGWTLTLQQACIALGPVYLFENPPLGTRGAGLARRRPPLAQRVFDWLVPSAHAHPGDATFAGGAVRGEWVDQISFDLLQPNLPVTTVNGLAGNARSFAVMLDPPRGALADANGCLRGHHAYAIGVAEKDGVRIAFEGGLDIPAEGTYRRVDGLPLDATLDESTRVTVTVQPLEWFRNAHFDRLTERNASGRYVVSSSTQPGAAWLQGARNFSAFTATAEELPQ